MRVRDEGMGSAPPNAPYETEIFNSRNHNRFNVGEGGRGGGSREGAGGSGIWRRARRTRGVRVGGGPVKYKRPRPGITPHCSSELLSGRCDNSTCTSWR